MKLSKVMALTAMGSGALVLATYLSACSSDPATTTTTTAGAKPPAKPSGPATTSTDTATFAVTDLYLGETDRAGAASATAWKSFGYNIDGKVTDKSSTDVCTRFQGAGSNVQVDGNTGIDNSFGANILPILQNVGQATPSKTISDSIKKGSFTLMLSVTGLTSDAKQTATGLKGQLFAGGAFDPAGVNVPTFAPTTDWPVRPELLADGKTVAGGSKVQFGDAYVVNGTWVAGTPASIVLSLGIGGVSLDIAINQAVITFDHTAADTGSNGTIAGVIDTEQLITGLKAVAGRLSKSLCQGSAFDGIANQIRQTSDIVKDGSNSSGVPCSGISIGIGFNTKQIANPTKVAPAAGPSADPCAADPDAGTVADAATGG